MSASLLWQLTRKSTSRTAKRTHPKCTMTLEKGSLANIRSPADSGLCNVRAVDVDADENGIPVLSLKNVSPDDARKPDKMWKETALNGGVRKALAKTDRALSAYRPVSKNTAKKRVSAIYKAQARKNRGINHASLKTGRTVSTSN